MEKQIVKQAPTGTSSQSSLAPSSVFGAPVLSEAEKQKLAQARAAAPRRVEKKTGCCGCGC